MRTWLLLLPALALGACSSLPHDGPNGRSINRQSQASDHRGYAVVELDYRAAQAVAASPPPLLASLTLADSAAPNDRIGVGDVLAVSIFETRASVGLSSTDTASSGGPANETLPHLTVGGDGAIMIPYAGRVRVLGLTPERAASVIQAALRGRVIDPQVDVGLVSNLTNTVTVIGEVRNVGRVPLSSNNAQLLDVLASAGGPTRPPGDITITVVRGSESASTPLLTLLKDPAQNIRLAPHDQVRLLYAPRKYSTFGAVGHVAEQQIEDESLSLAEALSKSGGLDTMTANAASVLVFRFERPQVADALGVHLPATSKGVPIIYRLNLMEPSGMFVANTFAIKANDLIYIPRSDSTELRKFLDLVSVVSQVTYNLTVTQVLK